MNPAERTGYELSSLEASRRMLEGWSPHWPGDRVAQATVELAGTFPETRLVVEVTGVSGQRTSLDFELWESGVDEDPPDPDHVADLMLGELLDAVNGW